MSEVIKLHRPALKSLYRARSCAWLLGPTPLGSFVLDLMSLFDLWSHRWKDLHKRLEFEDQFHLDPKFYDIDVDRYSAHIQQLLMGPALFASFLASLLLFVSSSVFSSSPFLPFLPFFFFFLFALFFPFLFLAPFFFFSFSFLMIQTHCSSWNPICSQHPAS